MSNKMLLALFVVGAVAVGTIALRNKTNEEAPVATEQVAEEAVTEATEVNAEATEATAEMAPEATVESAVADVVTEEGKNC